MQKEIKEDMAGRGQNKPPKVLRVLLVEDVAPDSHGVKEALKTRPCKILRVRRISEVEQRLDRGQNFDAVLIDCASIRARVGVDEIKRIRSLAKRIPVVVIDSNEDETVAIKMINAGAEDYLCDSMIALDPIVLCHAVHCAVYRFRHMQEELAKKDMVINWMAGDYIQ